MQGRNQHVERITLEDVRPGPLSAALRLCLLPNLGCGSSRVQLELVPELHPERRTTTVTVPVEWEDAWPEPCPSCMASHGCVLARGHQGDHECGAWLDDDRQEACDVTWPQDHPDAFDAFEVEPS
jgi:hypothetical protein